MTRSRQRKLKKNQCASRSKLMRCGVPVASALLTCMQAAYAAESVPVNGLEEIVVTAQKRTENLQNVPVAIQAFDTAKLEKLNIVSLDDYVKYSPSVSYVRGQGQGGNGQPGSSHVYMRGVVTGGDGNHSGSQPSVGTYLDEQPVTTIDGTVDVHIYDIQRIEVLEGPQGTLYGASSQAGTIRIITNKPDPKEFQAGYDLALNGVQHGAGVGYTAEGFVNIPLSPIAAVRLVAWDERDSGYISNVAGTNAAGCIQNGVRTFLNWGNPNGPVYPSGPGPSPCPPTGKVGVNAISNAAYVKEAYNTVDTSGGRAALKLDLGDWSVTPTFMGQKVYTNGFFGYDPGVGDLQLAHFGPEYSSDSWYQAALTVNGNVSNFDITYAGGYMKRDTLSLADYSDYSLFYDRAFGSGASWTGDSGVPIMPQEFVYERGYFEKWSHELRVSTPKDLPFKATVGAFIQRQLHDIWEQYTMPGYGFTDATAQTPQPNGFAQANSIPGLNNTIWLTDEQRVDRDQAVFANLTWDIDSHWQLNGGFRYFKYDNSLQGFYGYAGAYAGNGPGQGVSGSGLPGAKGAGKTCWDAQNNYRGPSVAFSPCTNLDKGVSGNGSVPRVNATYKFNPDALVYVTYSKGFRPGGVNRTAVAGIGPYEADYLTNYEFGWKTQWLDHRLRWNGALFWEDWKNFQYSFLGPNSLTIIENGGNARIKGVESEVEFRATNDLTLSSSITWLQSVTTTDVCSKLGESSSDCAKDTYSEPWGFENSGYTYTGPLARKGTDMPVAPKFKGNVVARYTFPEVSGWQPFGQFSAVYQTQTAPVLRADSTQIAGMMPAWALMDLSLGATDRQSTLQLVVTNLADRRAQLSRFVQSANANQPYVIPAQPRTIELKFGQKF